MENPFFKIAVCGAGTMGSGIAQTFAAAGFSVVLYDLDTNVLERSKKNILQSLYSLEQKKRLSAGESMFILERIDFTTDISVCTAGLIIEAVIEDIEAKITLFSKLASVNSSETIFATNTSSLSITVIAERLDDPSRLAGMHFFNPAPIMKLVEVVKTKYSSDRAVATVIAAVKNIEKTPVLCQDAPGFIVNRVARPYYLEALHLVEKHGLKIKDVDDLLEGAGFKMGPFRLMDLIGNDINYSVSGIVYNALGKPDRLQPSALQQQMVNEGRLGRKSGKGYYEYPGQ